MHRPLAALFVRVTQRGEHEGHEVTEEVTKEHCRPLGLRTRGKHSERGTHSSDVANGNQTQAAARLRTRVEIVLLLFSNEPEHIRAPPVGGLERRQNFYREDMSFSYQEYPDNNLTLSQPNCRIALPPSNYAKLRLRYSGR